jgi:hypothetical protein
MIEILVVAILLLTPRIYSFVTWMGGVPVFMFWCVLVAVLAMVLDADEYALRKWNLWKR